MYHPLTLDLELLRTLRTVARVGSFTAAAARVHRTQSAVSMQIKRLEELVGLQLLHRNNQGIQLTAAGETLLAYASRMLNANDEAVAALTRATVAGSVRLGMPADYALTFLSSVLPFFAETFPQVQIEVHTDLSPELMRRLHAGELDLMLVPRAEAVIPGGELVWREPLCWVCARGEPIPETNPLPLAVFPQGCSYRIAMLAALEEAGRSYRIAYTSTSLPGIQAAVMTGFAISIVSRDSVLPGMRVLEPVDGFPSLPDAEIMLHTTPGNSTEPVRQVAAYILGHLRNQAMKASLVAAS